MEDIVERIRRAPEAPGVYLFRDAHGDVLYVGKALSLRKRLANYLSAFRTETPDHPSSRVMEMARRAASVEWIIASSEQEALLLEHNFIRRHRPPFNIRLRDDKSYPYIVVTLEDTYPRVMFTRAPHRKGNLYFGPYSSAAKVRETLDTLGQIFPFRKCRGEKPGRHSGSPCLQSFIHRCLAPCEGAVQVEVYRRVVQQVIDFLEGRGKRVLTELEEQMRAAAKDQDFERAAQLRDRLAALQHVLERQQVRLETAASADIIGMARKGSLACVLVFLTRDGVLADRRVFTLEDVEEADDQELLERFVGEYYAGCPSVPRELVVPREADADRLAQFIRALRGVAVRVHTAERGDKRRLQELASRNAELALEQEALSGKAARERRWQALQRLQELAGLPRAPMRIEGYDISTLGGENTVASMVVFRGVSPHKDHYRRFAISLADQNDPAAIGEVIRRRFERAMVAVSGEAACETDPAFAQMPDLVLVDGGVAQLGAAQDALESIGLGGRMAVLSLAKRHEEVYVPGKAQPIRLPDDDPGLLLLQRVRDEAHRFAVRFHRVRREGQVTHSILDELPAVGERRKRAILRHFGSPEAFLAASREELEAVPGLPGKVARAIYDYLHKTG